MPFINTNCNLIKNHALCGWTLFNAVDYVKWILDIITSFWQSIAFTIKAHAVEPTLTMQLANCCITVHWSRINLKKILKKGID